MAGCAAAFAALERKAAVRGASGPAASARYHFCHEGERWDAGSAEARRAQIDGCDWPVGATGDGGVLCSRVNGCAVRLESIGGARGEAAIERGMPTDACEGDGVVASVVATAEGAAVARRGWRGGWASVVLRHALGVNDCKLTAAGRHGKLQRGGGAGVGRREGGGGVAHGGERQHEYAR